MRKPGSLDRMDAQACRRLWQAVLQGMLSDAVNLAPGSPNQMAADRWIRHQRGFVTVCQLAGFDPDWVRARYVAGGVRLSPYTDAGRKRGSKSRSTKAA